MPTADRQLAFARRWLSKARTDLALAILVLEKRPEMEPWAAAFHAQQAAEKAIKALLIARWIEPPRTHNLRVIAELLPDEVGVGASTQSLASISEFSSDVRYTGPFEQAHEPTWQEAEAAVAIARAVLAAVADQIGGK